MVCTPSGRIVACTTMENPENNEVVTSAFKQAVLTHSKANCIVYDRACSWSKSAQTDPAFKKIKHFSVDKWHGHRHTSKCKHSPKNSLALRRRLSKVNTSVCEQTFSWFRGYARPLNELMPNRNRLLVLIYAKMHNEMVADGSLQHLGMPGRRPTPRGQYGCAKNKMDKKAGKAVKKKAQTVTKKITAMKTVKGMKATSKKVKK